MEGNECLRWGGQLMNSERREKLRIRREHGGMWGSRHSPQNRGWKLGRKMSEHEQRSLAPHVVQVSRKRPLPKWSGIGHNMHHSR